MYIKLNNGSVEKHPYSVTQLRQDNPGISFPEQIPDTLLAEYGVYPVQSQPIPSPGHTKTVREGLPKLVDGVWKQVWVVESLTAAQVNEVVANLRKQAYIEKADPLFFKYQRGDATKEEWIAEVNAIKIQYPYAE